MYVLLKKKVIILVHACKKIDIAQNHNLAYNAKQIV